MCISIFTVYRMSPLLTLNKLHMVQKKCNSFALFFFLVGQQEREEIGIFQAFISMWKVFSYIPNHKAVQKYV